MREHWAVFSCQLGADDKSYRTFTCAQAVASGLGALRAARRPSKGSENALDTAQIAAVSSRLGWHVAFASIPASWRVPATARAVLLVVATEDLVRREF